MLILDYKTFTSTQKKHLSSNLYSEFDQLLYYIIVKPFRFVVD